MGEVLWEKFSSPLLLSSALVLDSFVFQFCMKMSLECLRTFYSALKYLPLTNRNVINNPIGFHVHFKKRQAVLVETTGVDPSILFNFFPHMVRK